MTKSLNLDLSPFPNELNFILWLLRKEDHVSHDPLLIETMCQGINWGTVLFLAQHHRVIPTIYPKMSGLDMKVIPDVIMGQFKHEYRSNTYKMLHLCGEMERVCRIFNQNQIRSLMLKGPILAEVLYGDISLRTSKDLDILVPYSSLGEVKRILLSLGYEPDEKPFLKSRKTIEHHISYTHPNKNVQIEIHWKLKPNSNNEPSFDEMWERRQVTTGSTCLVNYLGHEDLFFHLVFHGARHGWFRLRWLVDIDRMIRKGVNWSQVLPFMVKYKSFSICSQTLILTSQLLNTPLGGELAPIVTNSKGRELAQTAISIIDKIADSGSNPDSSNVHKHFRWYLLSLMTPSEKWNYFMALLYPSSKDAKTLPLPGYLHFLYFVLRPFLLVWRRKNRILFMKNKEIHERDSH